MRRIRLTESQLNRVIMESVKRIVKECGAKSAPFSVDGEKVEKKNEINCKNGKCKGPVCKGGKCGSGKIQKESFRPKGRRLFENEDIRPTNARGFQNNDFYEDGFSGFEGDSFDEPMAESRRRLGRRMR